jgi:hypothetical protein
MIRSPIARTGTLKPARTRSRKCSVKGCSGRVTDAESFVRWCSPACGATIALGRLAKQKSAQQRISEAAARAERRATKAKLEQFKRKPKWIAEVQDHNLPCISCDRHVPDDGRVGGVWDAGHYLSRGGSGHLRFDRRNVHKQCKGCNRPGGTTRAAFRAGMIKRLGLAAVEALEADQEPRHYTIEDLKKLKAKLTSTLKILMAK